MLSFLSNGHLSQGTKENNYRTEYVSRFKQNLITVNLISTRRLLFQSFDPNGNGVLSLAEVDLGIRNVLDCEEIFDSKPAILRAFQSAKSFKRSRLGEIGDDYIEFREFRYILP